MTSPDLIVKAEEYLKRLCLEFPDRRVGSQGNQTAVTIFTEALTAFGFQTQCPEFDCMDWSSEGAHLAAGNQPFEVFASPYTLGCQLSAPLVVASTVAELAAVEAADRVILLRGELAKEPLMPKNFPFYNPDEHKQIIQLLETKKPVAIIAATSRNPQMAGALYPFPLIEDGDFDIPSVYMREEEGERLAALAGTMLTLDIHARRIPAKGCNVVARKDGDAGRRVVFCAHIDSKKGTPGALDNASGVVVLLLLAHLLKDYQGRLGVEIVAINGEDYYSNPGEIQYLESNHGKFNEILLNVNIDGVGYFQGNSAYSLYECPDELASIIRKMFSPYQDIEEGESWYQGDHMLFVMNQVPAMALTSERAFELMAQLVHTPRDKPEIIASSRLVNLAKALQGLLLDLDKKQIIKYDSKK